MTSHVPAIVALALTTLLAAPPVAAQDVDFGNDSGEYALDGECDDPRFTGPGMSLFPGKEHRLADASDCEAAFAAGRIQLLAPGESPQAAFLPISPAEEQEVDLMVQACVFGDDLWLLPLRYDGRGPVEMLGAHGAVEDSHISAEGYIALWSDGDVILLNGPNSARIDNGVVTLGVCDEATEDVAAAGEALRTRAEPPEPTEQ